jgi:hypothetical protein
MLKRIRVIDMGNNWSAGTHGQYQGKLKVVRQFDESFGLSILPATHLDRPPASRTIPLAWAQGFYSLRPGQARGTNTVTTGISHNAVRGLRSAVTQFYSWEMQIAYPDSSTKDWSGRAVRTQGCIPMDTLAYAFMKPSRLKLFCLDTSYGSTSSSKKSARPLTTPNTGPRSHYQPTRAQSLFASYLRPSLTVRQTPTSSSLTTLSLVSLLANGATVYGSL